MFDIRDYHIDAQDQVVIMREQVGMVMIGY